MPSPANPLTRSDDNRLLAGVCGGIADWLGWDATLVRVLYVLVSFFSVAFPGIIAYVVLWFVMPRTSPREGYFDPQTGAFREGSFRRE